MLRRRAEEAEERTNKAVAHLADRLKQQSNAEQAKLKEQHLNELELAVKAEKLNGDQHRAELEREVEKHK